MMNNPSSVNMNKSQWLLSKVPEMTVIFWITKILTTGMGEVFSDYLVLNYNPIIAVIITGIILAATLFLQFRVNRYIAWVYWLVVVMVSIFGTMAADIVHVVLGIPYLISTIFFTAALAAVFIVWYVVEKTLSIHSIYTPRREFFYWCTVLATFALGTADGDMTAHTLNLGFLTSGVLFTILLALPAIGYGLFRLNPIFAFWFAYIMTRPVGASFSDWVSKPQSMGGLGWGEGPVSLVLTLIIIILVAYLAVTRIDVKKEQSIEKRRVL